MVTQIKTEKLYSPEEYLSLEVNSEEKHEYINGEIISMIGGTPNHNKIAGNLYAALNLALKRQPYQVFITDQRLWIPTEKIYTYPDVMIIEGELQFQEGRRDTLTNPIIIAEVLSTSTEGFDRGKKFAAYRTISTFKEYILIDQYTMQVEQFTKTESGQWLLSEYRGEESKLSLKFIDFEITLADLYDKVNFDS
ncbi:Uma2 family endonuclease [Dapis sp. BLCC M126]|uniref:Uma2 family endonuclease n=1 Tax=Dapis sp. BLCC M126 TaxID=3400189 RepID=UPI003CEEECD9